jgi:hypothetical protein
MPGAPAALQRAGFQGFIPCRNFRIGFEIYQKTGGKASMFPRDISMCCAASQQHCVKNAASLY